MMHLSKRMQALADLVSPCTKFCDVGTDHGFLPIYLIQAGKCQSAIAMDLRKGPLERAKEHIAEQQLEDVIETRLSDGVQRLAVGEADSVLIAGMGGQVTIHILTEGLEVCKHLKELILQPQSEIQEVREFVFRHGFRLLAEDMVEEDGKYYPMMKLVHESQLQEGQPLEEIERNMIHRSPSEYSQLELLYGPMLIAKHHPVLQAYLKKDLKRQEAILSKLPDLQEERILARRQVVEENIAKVKSILD